MKHIKLFENWKSLNEKLSDSDIKIKEIIDDIKSITYELEENNCTIKFVYGLVYNRYNMKFTTYFSEYDYNEFIETKGIEVEDAFYNSSIGNVPDDAIVNKITIEVYPNDKLDGFDDQVEKFVNLLKEHLDYIKPDNITYDKVSKKRPHKSAAKRDLSNINIKL